MRSLSSQATSPRPGIGGSVARVPTLRNTWGATSRAVADGDVVAAVLGAGEAGLAVDERRARPVCSSESV